ncbi:MAG TPA: haloacid dehalogenase-like hydrolase [Gemmatimonadaceae bacterium]
MRRLVLFDIDGTLLHSHGAGRRAMEAALLEIFGTTGSTAYRYDGKTDRQIVRDLMRGAGFDDGEIDARMPRVMDAYVSGLEREIVAPHTRVEALTGVMALLDALVHRAHCTVGLLTGNLEPGAQHKLVAAGIGFQRFAVGAFGSDHEIRAELPAIAQARARERLGLHFDGRAMVIVGDTPSDIACGRPIGARAIAVATGYYSMEALDEHGPDALFSDLGDTDAVLAAIDDA